MANLNAALEQLAVLNRRLEQAERDQKTRADSEARREQHNMVVKREMQQKESDYACRQTQIRADECLSAWGRAAPRPAAGISAYAYRRIVGNHMIERLPHDHELANINCLVLNDDAMNAMEDSIYDAAKKAAKSNTSTPPGVIEARHVINDENGRKEVHFVGDHSFVRDFMPTPRKARLVTIQEIAGLKRSGAW